MKKSCVSAESGAEPQISAFRFGPMLFADRRETSANVQPATPESTNRAFVPLALALKYARWARVENQRSQSAALLNRFLDFRAHPLEQRRNIQK